MKGTLITGREKQDDERRARLYLTRRLIQRRRKAEGLPVDVNFGGAKYNVPSRKVAEAGVEGRRAQRVKVTLPKLNLPELGDD